MRRAARQFGTMRQCSATLVSIAWLPCAVTHAGGPRAHARRTLGRCYAEAFTAPWLCDAPFWPIRQSGAVALACLTSPM